MRATIFLVISLFACAAAEDTIATLFETRSIPEYDQWLWHHRKEYAGFRPISAQVGIERRPSGWGYLYAISYTDSGTVRRRYVYPDSWNLTSLVQMSPITINEDGDRFAVRRWFGPAAGTTAYDQSGRKLFDSGREVTPSLGLWFRDIANYESTQVLNDRGLVIGVLPKATGRIRSSGDTLFVAPTSAGTTVFDRRALRVLWRDGVRRAGPYVVTISSDGREVGIAAWDSVIVHDLVTGSTTAMAVDSATGPRRGLDGIAWSGDGCRIAMYRRDTKVPDSATLWEVNRDGRLASPARRLAASYTEHLFWMGETVVLVASPYDPNMRKWIHDKPLGRGSCKVTAVALSGKTREWTVPGLFGQLGGWYQQGRNLAYIDTELSYYAVFQVPVQ